MVDYFLYSRMLIRKEFKLSYVSCRMEFARMANGNLSNLYIYSREASSKCLSTILQLQFGMHV